MNATSRTPFTYKAASHKPTPNTTPNSNSNATPNTTAPSTNPTDAPMASADGLGDGTSPELQFRMSKKIAQLTKVCTLLPFLDRRFTLTFIVPFSFSLYNIL